MAYPRTLERPCACCGRYLAFELALKILSMVHFSLRFDWLVQSKFQGVGRVADKIEQRDCRCVFLCQIVHLLFLYSFPLVAMYGKIQRCPEIKLSNYLCLVIKQLNISPLPIFLRSSFAEVTRSVARRNNNSRIKPPRKCVVLRRHRSLNGF